jgi:hypothetical protein
MGLSLRRHFPTTAQMSANIFFSYSRTDGEFVLKLAKDLRSAGADLWIDQLDIRPGTRWDDEVEKALKAADTVIAILSPAAVASQNIMDEVSYALEENKRLIPIIIAKCEIPFRLKRLQYIDFTEGYEDDFAQLCRVLGLAQPAAGAVAPPAGIPPHKSTTATPNERSTAYTAADTSDASGRQMPRKWLYLGIGLVVVAILSFLLFRHGNEAAVETVDQQSTTNPAQAVLNVDSVVRQAKYEEDSNENYRLAADLYRMAAEAGNRDAMYALALIYEYNIADFDSLMYWCERGAYAGEPYAMKKYGNLLTRGSEEFPLRKDRINKDSGAYWLSLLNDTAPN